MALVLALLAAVSLGASDVLAARASRTNEPLLVSFETVRIASVLSLALLMVAWPTWTLEDTAKSVTAGLLMVGGLVLVHRSYAVEKVGIIAPMSTALAASVPVVAEIVSSGVPALKVSLGMLAGLVAIVVGSTPVEGVAPSSRAVALGLGAGSLFGLALVMMSRISDDFGVASIAVQRASGLLLLVILLAMRRDRGASRRLGPSDRASVRLAGVLALSSLTMLQIAFQWGDAGPVAVAGSQYGTAAVVLAVVASRESLHRRHLLGAAVAGIAVALMATA